MTELIKENWKLIGLLIVIGFFVYAFNLSGLLFWDDKDWIVNNPFVHHFSWLNVKNWFSQNILAGIKLSSNYYRPFLLFTFALNYAGGGENPLGYHLFSNGLHLANAVLIFFILLTLFKNRWLAFWTSLLWLIHPLQTEAISYVSGRGDPLNVFFMLGALILFWKAQFPSLKFFSRPMTFSLLGLVLALLSRETAIIFPLLLTVFYIAFLSGDKFLKSLRTALKKIWPYFLVVFVYGLLRLTIFNFENTLNFYSQSNVYTENLTVRIYTFLNVLWTYAGLIIVPLEQHMERSVTIYTYFWNWPTFASLLTILAVLGVLKYLYRRDKIPNSKPATSYQQPVTSFRVWFFAVGWFFVNLGPTSGLTPINAQLYEHWLYLAILGPLLLLVFYLNQAFKIGKQSVKVFILLFLFFTSSFFSFLSIKRNILWSNPIKFFENILQYEPDSARINNNLGYLYYDQDNKEKAAEYYLKATQTTGNLFPQPYFNLGAILQERGDLRGAIVMFEKAIELDPNFAYPYPNLSVIYASQGDLVKATDYLEKLKELQPRLTRTYYNLALVYLERNDLEAAYQNLQEGLKYRQFDPETGVLIEELLQKFETINKD